MLDGNRKVDLPLQTRLAPIGDVDVEARTADLVWSTGGRVKRYDWERGQYYMEELSLEPGHVRMGRLDNGAPLLNTHNQWDLAAVMGVVEPGTAKVDGKRGVAAVRFSKRDDVEPFFRDVKDKIIRNVSVGYARYRMEQLPADDRSEGLQVYRVIDWEPMELSLVPIGADAGAGVRSEQQQQRTYSCEIIDVNPADPAITRVKESTMDEQQRAAEEAAKKKAAEEAEKVRAAEAAAATAASAATLARVKDIRALCATHKLDRAFEDGLINDPNITIEAARAKVLDELAKKTSAADIRSGLNGIETVSDETDVRRAGAVEALMHRVDPGKIKLTDNGKQFRGMTLRELVRDCLEHKRVNTRGMSVAEMWQRTFESGSDLPNIVLDVANKSLRAAYASTSRTFTGWARQGTAPDFKNINRVMLSGAPALLEVKSGGEFKRGVVTDGKETYALTTYGRIIGINRQTIINDDMDAFTRLPALAARAAADLESDTVYGILTGTALMADGIALFSTSHLNIAAATAAISVTSLGEGRAAMRKQKGLENRPINLLAKYLIVPAALETLAEQYTSADFVSAKSSDINPFRTGRPSALEVVAEPRLDATSATQWYMSASPDQIDTVEYSHLEGQEGVYLETRMGWDVDGMELKVREDFAAKALDYRGLFVNK